jgi:hypothetical protein
MAPRTPGLDELPEGVGRYAENFVTNDAWISVVELVEATRVLAAPTG